MAKKATTPNFNFLFAKNASLLGRIGMTLTGKRHKTCINMVTSFFNEYHICSNCEDFVAKRATYEKDGKKIEVNDLSVIPSFYADYYLKEDVVRIKCSAGNLVLTKGVFFYGYKGVHKGIVVTVRAYLENNKLEQIVYEELDEKTRMAAIVSYYKRDCLLFLA